MRLGFEREAPQDPHLDAVELEHVVARLPVAAHAHRGHGAGVRDVEILQAPDVRHVLVPRQHDVDAAWIRTSSRSPASITVERSRPVPGIGSR